MYLFFMENNIVMIILWFIVCLAALGIEISTTQLVSIWFTGGAFISLILACFNVDYRIQLIVFVVASLLLLIFTKPFLKQKFIDVHKNTNVNSIVGHEVEITQEVSLKKPGAGKIRDVTWTCKTQDETPINEGEFATIIAINGNSLIVTKKGK